MTESESVALPLGDTPIGSWSRVRTCDIVINSHALYRLSYSGIYSTSSQMILTYGAENGTRTRDPNLGKVVLYHWATSASVLATTLLYHCLVICQATFKTRSVSKAPETLTSCPILYHTRFPMSITHLKKWGNHISPSDTHSKNLQMTAENGIFPIRKIP